MTAHAHLLAAVLAAPGDDLPRLVLADWLDDRGLPGDAERAAFIRAQCKDHARATFTLGVSETAASRFDSPHKFPVLIGPAPEPEHLTADATFFRDWGVWPPGARLEYRRGFVSAVTCPAADWLAHGSQILDAHPVREVTLTTEPEWEYVDHAGGRLVRLNGRDRAFVAAEICAVGEDTTLALLRAEWPRVRAWTLPPRPVAANWDGRPVFVEGLPDALPLDSFLQALRDVPGAVLRLDGRPVRCVLTDAAAAVEVESQLFAGIANNDPAVRWHVRVEESPRPVYRDGAVEHDRGRLWRWAVELPERELRLSRGGVGRLVGNYAGEILAAGERECWPALRLRRAALARRPAGVPARTA